MTDVENTFRAELNRMLVVDATPDWDAILVTASVGRERAQRRQRLAVAAAALLATAAVALVTPLGGAIARGLEGFSTWLTGEPGTPVSEQEQRAFAQENRTWRGFEFPQGTQLRRLITRRVGDSTIELLGYRSGQSLCLRVVVSGALTERATECAPLAELRRQGGVVRVLIAGEHVGRGDKEAWYGLDRFVSAKLLVTAGIAADGVEAVVLRDDRGRHEVPVESNAFVYVAEEPEVKQRVHEVWARTAAGLVAVPFASPGAPRAVPPAPPIEREVSGGRIGWLEEQEERGEPLDVIPPQFRVTPSPPGHRLPPWRFPGPNAVFGRVVTPDPARSYRLALALATLRPGGSIERLCIQGITPNGGNSGCVPYPETFELWPFNFGAVGGGPFMTIDGFASDDVARLEILLADGTRIDVPLADNAFIADIPTAGLPGRAVAYDSEGRVISSSMTLEDTAVEPEPARGKAELLWRVTGPNGSSFELSVGPSNQGGECQFLEHFITETNRGVGTYCTGAPKGTDPPVEMLMVSMLPRLVGARVRDDVKTVRLRFADGETLLLEPRRRYVVYAVPGDRMAAARAPTVAEGLDASGRVIGRATFPRVGGG